MSRDGLDSHPDESSFLPSESLEAVLVENEGPCSCFCRYTFPPAGSPLIPPACPGLGTGKLAYKSSIEHQLVAEPGPKRISKKAYLEMKAEMPFLFLHGIVLISKVRKSKAGTWVELFV
jgi:hypothetical protein